MKLLRNPEVFKTVILYGIVSLAALLAAFYLEWSFAILTLVLCVVLTGIHLYATTKRYAQIEELSMEIDRILHGSANLTLKNENI